MTTAESWDALGSTPRAGTRPAVAITAQLAWSLGGTAAQALSQWAVILLLARTTSTGSVGIYALGLAISAPVMLFASLSLRTVLVTDTAARFQFREYLLLRLACMGLAVVVTAGIAAFAAPSGAAVVFAVAVAKALDGVADIYYGHLQRRDRMRTIGTCMAVNAVVSVAATWVLLAATGSPLGAAIGCVVGSAAGTLVSAVTTRPGAAIEPGATTMPAATEPGATTRPTAPLTRPLLHTAAALVSVALPLGLASSVTSVTANLPRYLVGRSVDLESLGVFAALSYVLVAATVGYHAAAQVILPRMARWYAVGDLAAIAALTRRLVLGCLALGAVAVAAVAGTGEPILRALYGTAYAQATEAFTVLTLAAVLAGANYTVGTALSALRRFGHHLRVSLATLVVTVACGLILVPRYGVTAAAWLTVLSMVTDGLAKLVLLRSALRARS